MNHLITDQLPPPPPPLQPPRSSFTCDRHHNDNFTGFCPSCLSERLTILDQSTIITTTTTTAADLRRTKSFSVLNNKELCVLEPQRKSCDVNTLSSLFSIDDTNLNDLEDEIVEMEARIDSIVDNLKSCNLDLYSKKSNFWSTASKKWKKWRKRCVGRNGIVLSTTLPVGKCRETQSEVADYGYGRRSCDIDPGRVSFDGYLIGRSFPRLPIKVVRSDMQIPVEEPGKLKDYIPGGSIQTREYYNHIHCRSKFHSIGGEKELGMDSNSESKKSRWWSWKLLGFINRKAANNHGDITSGRFNTKLSRSSTSVSWRNTKSNSIENNSNNRRIGDEFVFERNASARYSPNHVNEGLLRFYLTPLRLRGTRRSESGKGTVRSRLF